MDTFSLTVIVPALNEAENLEAAVGVIRDSLESAPRVRDWQIIVVNDGSQDHTAAIARRMSSAFPRIAYLEHAATRGIGASYRSALARATCDYVTWLAGDNSYIKAELLRYLSQMDLRRIPVAYPSPAMALKTRSLLRRFLSKGFGLTVRVFFGLKGVRYTNGMAIYPRSFLESITITSNGFFIGAELLLRAVRAGYSFQNILLDSVERTKGTTKVFKPAALLETVRNLAMLYGEFYLCHRPHRQGVGP